MTRTAAPIEDHRFPCPTCGSDLRYLPGSDLLHCDHCGNEEPIRDPGPWTGAIVELDFEAALKHALPAQEIAEIRSVTCQSCGATVEYDESLHARECPFCATPFVTGTGTHRMIKPKGVLPFTLDERAARQAMSDWLGRLWFAPNGLQEYARKGRSLSGIYVPYWTFDADTRTHYTGQRGTVHSTGTGKNRRTTVRWRNVSGRVARMFDDVLVLASHSLPRKYTDALEPWDLAGLEPYQPEYLAGFRAEGYQVDLAPAFDIARGKMDDWIRRDIRFDIGGDRQRITTVDTTVSDVTFKHVLLPVWIAAYRFRGQAYRCVINARTGRVEGQRPWSPWKIAFATLLGLILLGGLFYLQSQTQ